MKRRSIYYVPLLALFVIAVVYQTRYTMDALREDFRAHEIVRQPFAMEELEPIITRLRPEAEEAGLRKGDRVLAVGDRPLTGAAVFDQLAAGARPGDSLSVVVRRAGAETTTPPPTEQRVTIRWAAARASAPTISEWLPFVLIFEVMPVFCLLLGFWVVAARPRDPLAWLLLGLMLSFGQLRNVPMGHWQWWLRDAMVVYHIVCISAWSLWMLLFGIYFPERLPLDRRWPWAKWVLIVPLLFILVVNIILELGSMENIATVAPLARVVIRFQGILFAVILAGICSFFVSLSLKAWNPATSPDARRRLRLMLFGTAASLTPMLFLVVIGRMRGTGPTQSAPAWISIPVMLLLFLFPLTLAYVIVVQRALDVRVVIRQGMRYALARNSVRVMQVLGSAVIIFIAAFQVASSATNRPQKIIVIALGVALVFLLGGIMQRLSHWIDRRFFREAYNAELILSDLSEKVRTMVETEPLLETVARRISESLHVRRVALLLQTDGAYLPAHALGYDAPPVVSFPEKSVTVHQLRRVNEPVLVYSDDSDSWVHKTPGMDKERAMLEELETQLLLPLTVKEKLPGFISLGPKRSEEPYSGTDLRLLQSVATQTGLALENSQLTAAIASEVAQRERLNREVEIAREVQERLFPQEFPAVAGLDYCGACRPAHGVGGDYYDFLLLPNEKLGIAIGDVSGKGISAALLMASLQASLRGQAMQGTNDLAALMSNVNRLVYDASAENRYATFFYAQYDPSTRLLAYVNAGHNPPMIFREREGQPRLVRLNEAGGVVVGLLRDYSYSQASVVLEPGDVMVAFTDGISEAMNSREEEWGEERMIEAVGACRGLSAAEMITRLINDADAFAAGARQHDDMTLVVVRVT
ncbi:MAG TPA: SpoIIE family protein phosphatase [Pyrinomonadaceae bacterium]|jgi:sigma-B regulation protein RsbU (phosphoserine phosphatase)|nr:SpoIIE family protein phosphatase [Pyrinomonadaceae bacterium]